MFISCDLSLSLDQLKYCLLYFIVVFRDTPVRRKLDCVYPWSIYGRLGVHVFPLFPLQSSFSLILLPPSPFSSQSFLSDFYPTHHLKARVVSYPEMLTARVSSQRPITTSGPSSWTPSASQPGPAWDAGVGGKF